MASPANIGQPVIAKRFEADATSLALAIAIIWMVHPLVTEAVTYVVQRAESLMGLFYLLVLYGFIRGVDSSKPGRWYALSVTACLLGMATKEAMVSAPLMVLLYDRTFVSGSFQEAWTRHRRLYLGLGGTWVLLGYLMVGLHYRGIGYGLGISWWAYALIECRAVVQYLWLALWPHPLVFDYGEFVAVRHVGEVAPYAVILAILVAGVLVELKRQPAIGFVGAWFFLILAPTSSVVPIGGQPMAEHRMYLPLAAVVALVVLGGANLGRYVLGRWQQTRRILEWGVSAAVVLVLTLLTIQRNQDYMTRLTIWLDTVAKRPNNPRAHLGVANALYESDPQEAIGQDEEALRLKTGLCGGALQSGDRFGANGQNQGSHRALPAGPADQARFRRGAQQPRDRFVSDWQE